MHALLIAYAESKFGTAGPCVCIDIARAEEFASPELFKAVKSYMQTVLLPFEREPPERSRFLFVPFHSVSASKIVCKRVAELSDEVVAHFINEGRIRPIYPQAPFPA